MLFEKLKKVMVEHQSDINGDFIDENNDVKIKQKRCCEDIVVGCKQQTRNICREIDNLHSDLVIK